MTYSLTRTDSLLTWVAVTYATSSCGMPRICTHTKKDGTGKIVSFCLTGTAFNVVLFTLFHFSDKGRSLSVHAQYEGKLSYWKACKRSLL